MSSNKPLYIVAGAVLVALLLPLSASSQSASNAADKAAVSGSTVAVLPPETGTTILSADIKTSGPTDLLLSFTAECSIWTTVTTVGNDMSESSAHIEAWIEIDGTPIPVGGNDASETGRVVLCDRLHRQTTSLFNDEDATIEQYQRTRQANGFNWATLDVGAGDHVLEVKVEFELASTPNASVTAAVGHRTLIVEPTKMAHGAEIEF